MKCDGCGAEEKEMFSPDMGGLTDNQQKVAEEMAVLNLDYICEHCFYEILSQKEVSSESNL
jgi:hypothetical protein